ncbi:MAG: hypothetical protein GC129_01825 [Proteobacteria bacterium]|nr:hypothetical protein [Pseudomonadota bacterium]
MTPALRALAILVALVAMLLLLARTGAEPVYVSLTWDKTTFSTTAPVAITFMLIAIVMVFYAGRFIGWLANLPHVLRAALTGHQHHSVWGQLVEGYTALYLGNTKAATKAAQKLPTNHPMAGPLITLMRLQTDQLSPSQAEAFLRHPILGPVVTLHFARRAATQKNWESVKHYSAAGLKLQPNQTSLINLHFKALLNTNDDAAITFLPQVKPQLSKSTYQLLSTVVAAGITTPHAAALSHPWVKAFQKWLPTASEVFPDEPKESARR